MATNDFLKDFALPKDFGKVPLVLIGMNLQLWWAGIYVGKLRRELFNDEFMKKHFGQVHKNELKEEILSSGYPDMGSGFYSQKLSYSDWYRFNIAQRIHQNYVENINFACVAVTAAGIVKPNYAVGVGIAYIIGRFLYSYYYKREKGAKNIGRILGVTLSNLAVGVGIGIYLWKFFKHGFA